MAVPSNSSQVHFTSADVKGFPSCHLTPCRSGNFSSVPSSFHDQLVARSGMIEDGLFCATCWSYITRLLNNPIAGRSAAPVASSCSDMLAGLSKNEILRTPPDFCASAPSPAPSASSSEPAIANRRTCRVMNLPSHCAHGFGLTGNTPFASG